MKINRLLLPILAFTLLGGCSANKKPTPQPSGSGDPTLTPNPTGATVDPTVKPTPTETVGPTETVKPTETPTPDPTIVPTKEDEDKDYVALFNPSSKVEFFINFSKQSLGKMIEYGQSEDYYKEDMYHPCTFKAVINGQVFDYNEVGARLRGNWSRKDDFDIDHNGNIYGDRLPHIKLNFSVVFNSNETNDYYSKSYTEDEINARKDRRFASLKKIDLKWNRNNDPSFTKELYALYAFRNEGVIAQQANLINLSISNGKTSKEKVYLCYESIDKQMIKKRYTDKKVVKGDLYKCTYNSNGPATLESDTVNKVGVESANYSPVYALKTNESSSDFSSMKNLIRNTSIKNTTAEEYKAVFDQYVLVDRYLRFSAMSWVVGNPDDLRNNYNNYYVYFNSINNKAEFIPYDNDRVFGIKDGMDTDISHQSMSSDRLGGSASGGGCAVPLIRRTIVPGSKTRPIISEYENIYKNYCVEFANRYLNNDAFKAFTNQFYYSSKVIDTSYNSNITFAQYASDKLSTIK